MNNYTIVDNDLYKDYDYLNTVLDHTLEHERVDNAIFSIIFVEDDEIHNINKEYRGIDRVTDVISFAFEDSKDLDINKMNLSYVNNIEISFCFSEILCKLWLLWMWGFKNFNAWTSSNINHELLTKKKC